MTDANTETRLVNDVLHYAFELTLCILQQDFDQGVAIKNPTQQHKQIALCAASTVRHAQFALTKAVLRLQQLREPPFKD